MLKLKARQPPMNLAPLPRRPAVVVVGAAAVMVKLLAFLILVLVMMTITTTSVIVEVGATAAAATPPFLQGEGDATSSDTEEYNNPFLSSQKEEGGGYESPTPNRFEKSMSVPPTAPLFAIDSILSLFIDSVVSGGGGSGGGGEQNDIVRDGKLPPMYTTEAIPSPKKIKQEKDAEINNPTYTTSSTVQRVAESVVSRLVREGSSGVGGGGEQWYKWWLHTYEKAVHLGDSLPNLKQHPLDNISRSSPSPVVTTLVVPFGSLLSITDLDRIIDSTSSIELLEDMNLKVAMRKSTKSKGMGNGAKTSWAEGEFRDLQKLSQYLTKIYDLDIQNGEMSNNNLVKEESSNPEGEDHEDREDENDSPAEKGMVEAGDRLQQANTKPKNTATLTTPPKQHYRRHRHIRRHSVIAELSRIEELSYRMLFSPVKTRLLGIAPAKKIPGNCINGECKFNSLDYFTARRRIRDEIPAMFGNTAVLGADVAIIGDTAQSIDRKLVELGSHHNAHAFSRLIPVVRRLAALEGRTLILRDAEGRHPLLRYLSLFIKHMVFGGSIDVGISMYYTPAPDGTQGGRCREEGSSDDDALNNNNGGAGTPPSPSLLPERASNVNPHIDSMDVIAIAVSGGSDCIANLLTQKRQKLKEEEEEAAVASVDRRDLGSGRVCVPSCLHKRWVLSAAAPHLHLPLKEYPTKESRGQPSATLNKRLHYYNPRIHDPSRGDEGIMECSGGSSKYLPHQATVTLVDPECGMELLSSSTNPSDDKEADAASPAIQLSHSMYIPRGVIHSTITSLSVAGSTDTTAVSSSSSQPPDSSSLPAASSLDKQLPKCKDINKHFPNDPTSSTPSTFFAALAENGLAPFPGSVHLSVGIEPIKESRDGHSTYLNLIQSYIRTSLIGKEGRYTNKEGGDEDVFGPFIASELDIDAAGSGGGGSSDDSAAIPPPPNSGVGSENDDDGDDGFIRVRGSGGGSLRTNNPTKYTAIKKMLDSGIFTFPTSVFNSGHISLLLLQSLGNSATSRDMIGLRKAVVVPPTDAAQTGRTSPFTLTEYHLRAAQWARHITVLSTLFGELCDLYGLDCSGVRLSSSTTTEKKSPASASSSSSDLSDTIHPYPSNIKDTSGALKRWSRMVLGSLLTRDFLFSHMDVWLGSSREYRNSVLEPMPPPTTATTDSNNRDTLSPHQNGYEDPSFDIESFLALLTDSGTPRQGVLYGRIGAMSGDAATKESSEDWGGCDGVAVKGWKMSRAAALSSPAHRTAVMARYVLSAVRDLLEEAVTHVETYYHHDVSNAANNNNNITPPAQGASPLFVQRWRDHHMAMKDEDNAAFRHWADLNEYLLLDASHKGRLIDLDVEPLFKDTPPRK